ncbi:MAG TPA: DUF6151 family protein [Xanthobacteraceae bacterium]|jgi:hypothetical protein|nr:DUF6151 family protein [Xanthobacteraceae bacterium]
MPFDLSLQCECGRVRGTACDVSPTTGSRFVCYCTDCQAFARFLDRPDVLDSAGGTDIFQLPPGRVTLTAGADAVRCLCFSKRVLRWYTDCCRTPIGNTASSSRFPVVGLIHSFMDRPFMSDGADGPSRDEMLGPPRCRLYGRSAIGALPPTAPPPLSMRLYAGHAAKLLGWWARGLTRPNPFFDERSNVPLAAPLVLAQSERAAV